MSNPFLNPELFAPPNPIGGGMTPPAMGSPFDNALAPATSGALTPFDVPAIATPPLAAPRPPQVPTFTVNQPAAPGAPNFLSMALPLIASALIGRKDPRAIAEGLAGFMKGRELRRAEQESIQEREERRRNEAAKFYADASQNLSQIDDPIQFSQTLDALAPFLQMHGLSREAFQFNDQKLAARTEKEAGQLLDALDKQHPDGNYSVDWKDPKTGTTRRIPRPDLAQVARRGAFDAQGQSIGPSTKPAAVPKPRSDFDEFWEQEFLPAEAERRRRAGKPAEMTAVDREEAKLRARKAFSTVDDKGTDPTLAAIRDITLANLQNAGLTPAQETAARGLADDFSRDTKDYQVRLDALMTMRQVSKKPSAAGDIALVFSFMKLQDPNSAVRETEYANAQNAAGVPERVRNLYNKLLSGEFLSPTQRADFLDQSSNIFAAARQKYDITRASYETRARARGIKPELIITDYDALLTDADRATPAAGGNGAPTTTGAAAKADPLGIR